MTTTEARTASRDTTKATEKSVLVRKRKMFERQAQEMAKYGIIVEIPDELASPQR
jgi:hypothetical protein